MRLPVRQERLPHAPRSNALISYPRAMSRTGASGPVEAPHLIIRLSAFLQQLFAPDYLGFSLPFGHAASGLSGCGAACDLSGAGPVVGAGASSPASSSQL